MNKQMRIVITGGGTGGHIMPLISVVREIKKLRSVDLHTYYLGPKKDAEILKPEVNKAYSIFSGKLRRYFSLQNLLDFLFFIPAGLVQSFFLLLFINPKLVFSKGGSGSLVVCYAARILDIPVFFHESDSVPGLSNKMVAKWARKMFTAFPKTEYLDERGALAVGNPLRQELLSGDILEAKKMFAITSEKPVILISGGSLGAQDINNFIVSILEDLLRDYEIIHIAGAKNYQKVQVESSAVLMLQPELKSFYHLYDSLNEVLLKNAYSIASLIISRAGGGNIFEIAAVGKPSILIPLPSSASNHQSKNAYQYSQTGAAITIEQNNLTPHFFIGQIENLLSKSEKTKTAALAFARPKAAQKIAKEIISFIENEKTYS